MIDKTLHAQAAPLGLRVLAQGNGSPTRHVYRDDERLFSGRPGQIENFLAGYAAAPRGATQREGAGQGC